MPQVETLQIYEANKAMIDSAITTAKAYPRNMQRFMNNCIADINNAPMLFVESLVYTVPRGVKKITGPSVHLATLVSQYFQNLRIEARVSDIDHKHITCEGICFDLENNIAVKKQIKRLILDKNGDRYNDDMITVTGNAGNSIALRNAVFAVVPKLHVDMIFAKVKKRITGDVSTEDKLIAKRKTIFDALQQRYEGVTEQDILKSLGKESINHVGEDEIFALIGIETALREGDTTVDYAFKGKKRESPPENVREKRLIEMILNCTTEQQLSTFKKDVHTNPERIAYDEQLQKIKNRAKTDKS